MRQEGPQRSTNVCVLMCLFVASTAYRVEVVKCFGMNSLPANDLITAGIKDLQYHRETIPALLVAIGAPKLRSLGLEVPEPLPLNPEHRLYDLLSTNEPDSAHSRYNALIRKLVSFERALACVTE
jgi:hypothetical protein